MNECKVASHNCPNNSTCFNKKGTFNCICDSGYISQMTEGGDMYCDGESIKF